MWEWSSRTKNNWSCRYIFEFRYNDLIARFVYFIHVSLFDVFFFCFVLWLVGMFGLILGSFWSKLECLVPFWIACASWVTEVWHLSRGPWISKLIITIGSYCNFRVGCMFRFGFGSSPKGLALFAESCQFKGFESS